MSLSRKMLWGILMIVILLIGTWLGSRLHNSPQLIPAAHAQGIVVNQDQPDQQVAAVFTISGSGEVLFWWRVQNNGLGKVTIFDSRTGHVRERDFRR